MEIITREADINDLDEVLEIYKDAGLNTQGNINPEDARNIYKKMKSYPNYKLYVAEDNGKIYGTFALLIMDNLANGGMPSGIVEDVAVISGAQGKGIGKTMMKYALEECRHICIEYQPPRGR